MNRFGNLEAHPGSIHVSMLCYIRIHVPSYLHLLVEGLEFVSPESMSIKIASLSPFLSFHGPISSPSFCPSRPYPRQPALVVTTLLSHLFLPQLSSYSHRVLMNVVFS